MTEHTEVTDGKYASHPDPSALTTAQLYREIEALREATEKDTAWAEKLNNEQHKAIQAQFVTIESQRVEQKVDAKTAVADALQAAKEAVKEQTAASEKGTNKSEGGMLKSLGELTTQFNTQLSAQSTQITDLKERVSKSEALKQGGKDTINGIVVAVGGIVSLLMMANIVLTLTSAE